MGITTTMMDPPSPNRNVGDSVTVTNVLMRMKDGYFKQSSSWKKWSATTTRSDSKRTKRLCLSSSSSSSKRSRQTIEAPPLVQTIEVEDTEGIEFGRTIPDNLVRVLRVPGDCQLEPCDQILSINGIEFQAGDEPSKAQSLLQQQKELLLTRSSSSDDESSCTDTCSSASSLSSRERTVFVVLRQSDSEYRQRVVHEEFGRDYRVMWITSRKAVLEPIQGIVASTLRKSVSKFQYELVLDSFGCVSYVEPLIDDWIRKRGFLRSLRLSKDDRFEEELTSSQLQERRIQRDKLRFESHVQKTEDRLQQDRQAALNRWKSIKDVVVSDFES